MARSLNVNYNYCTGWRRLIYWKFFNWTASVRYSGTAALAKGLTVEEKSRFFPGWVVRLGVNVVIYLAFHTVALAGRHRSLHSMWFSESEQCRRPFFSAVIFLFSRPACPIATKFTAKSGPAVTIQSRRDSSWKCVARSYLHWKICHDISVLLRL